VVRSHPYLDQGSIIAFAHRGGAVDQPENSMIAFQRAIEMGYRYIETDVHATKDGTLMAFHDDDLQRTCGLDIKISDVEYSGLSNARIDGKEPIPTLEEILSAWPNIRVNIDCKSDQAVEPLIAALQHGDVVDRVCIGSFSDRRLGAIRDAIGPRLCSSLGPREVAKLRLLSKLTSIKSFAGAHAAQIPLKQGPITLTNKQLVDHAHEIGLHVHVWTINDAEEMHNLVDLGVDGIMTDTLQTLKNVMIERNQWTNNPN
jgi:glycerophosphoryl diester phosphodiesterase